jgi:hypothetical protein
MYSYIKGNLSHEHRPVIYYLTHYEKLQIGRDLWPEGREVFSCFYIVKILTDSLSRKNNSEVVDEK